MLKQPLKLFRYYFSIFYFIFFCDICYGVKKGK